MAKVKVLRLIEYTYDDVETMERDMENWGVQKILRPNHKTLIKSITLPIDVVVALDAIIEDEKL